MEVTFANHVPPDARDPSLSIDVESLPNGRYAIRYQSNALGQRTWFEWSVTNNEFIPIAQELRDSYFETLAGARTCPVSWSPNAVLPIVPRMQAGPSTPPTNITPAPSRSPAEVLSMAEQQLEDAQESLQTSQEALEVAKKALDVAKEYYNMSRSTPSPTGRW